MINSTTTGATVGNATVGNATVGNSNGAFYHNFDDSRFTYIPGRSTAVSVPITSEMAVRANDTSVPALSIHYSSFSLPTDLTPEESTTEERNWEIRRERERERRQEREAAQMRARELLLMHLDEAQREEYEARQRFEVEVRDRRYLICRERQGNVYRMEEGVESWVECWCIHPSEDIPLEDQMLAQKLMLEIEEEEFFRIANLY